MLEYFLIFLVMLVCVTVGIWIGMLCEKKASYKAENARYRPFANAPVETDLTNYKEPPVTMPNDSQPIATQSTPDVNNTDHDEGVRSNGAIQCHPQVVASPLAQKVSPDFDDELDHEEATAIEEKMRHQDAAFNTLSTHTDE